MVDYQLVDATGSCYLPLYFQHERHGWPICVALPTFCHRLTVAHLQVSSRYTTLEAVL